MFSIFQQFFTYVEIQFSSTIRVLRSNSRCKYMSHDFHAFLQIKGIIFQRSCLYIPLQNGVVKRKNRHLLDVVRTLLLESFIPSKFWVEALSIAIYLINQLPSQVLNFKTRYFFIISILPILICIPLVVFVLSIFHHMNLTNFLLNQLNVLLCVIVFHIAMIHALTNFVSFIMLFSL